MKLVIALILVVLLSQHASTDSHFRYGIVVDGGSTGTRSRIYRWAEPEGDKAVPDISELTNLRIQPPIADFMDSLDQVPAYIQQILDHARQNVPEAHHDTTDIYFMATSGMRFLGVDATPIIEAVNNVFADGQKNPFRYNPQNTRVLAGEEEAAYAWLAVNYLRDSFSGTTNVGVMELGSGSTQISFLPPQNPLAGIFPVRLGGVVYRLYAQSYLNYGQDRAYIQTALNIKQKEGIAGNTIMHPCVLVGDTLNYTVGGVDYSLQGSGNSWECEALIDEYVYEVAPGLCYPKPCALGPFYQPPIPATMTMYGIAAFYYPIPVFQLGGADGVVTLNAIRQAALNYCNMTLNESLAIADNPEQFASTRCLAGLYTYKLLTRSYGLAPDSTQIRFLNDIDGEFIQWTLGALLYEADYTQSLNTGSQTHPASVGPLVVLAFAVIKYFGTC